MIVDVHTHVFPPRMVADRARLAEADPGFGALYANPKARMADAEALLVSMDAAGVDVAVAAGFTWASAAHAREHREYLIAAGIASAGRVLPFVPVAPGEPLDVLDDAARRGARGIGELRPGPDAGAWTVEMVRHAGTLGLATLVHCTEEVGHEYAGKHGGLTPGGLWRLTSEVPDARIIAAHWGGGFPFYGLMPEVRTRLADWRLVFDTAATPLLYEPRVFDVAHKVIDERLVLWGSDFPLRDQRGDRAAIETAVGDADRRAAILGGNAARFLGL